MSGNWRENRWRHRWAGSVVLAVVLVAVSCGGGTTGSSAAASSPEISGPVTLQVAQEANSPAFQTMWAGQISAFEAANPKIKVNTTYFPVDQYANTVTTQLKGGGGPDIFYSNGGSGQIYSALTLGKVGQAADLSQQSWAKDIPSSARSLFFSGNKLYALPLAVSPVGIAYNTDLLQSWGADVPTTFGDLVKLCATAKAHGATFLAFAGANPQNTGLLGQMIASSYVYDTNAHWNADRANNKVTFANSAGWKNALNAIVKMNQAGCFQPGASGASTAAAQALVGQKKAAAYPAPGIVIGTLQALVPGQTIAMMPFPGATSANTRPTLAYSDALAVNNRSKSKAAAIKFIDFLATGDRPTQYAKATSTLTIQQALSGKQLPTTVQSFEPYVKSGKTAALANLTWPNGVVYSDFGSGVTGLLTGQLTPESLLQQMDSDWNQ